MNRQDYDALVEYFAGGKKPLDFLNRVDLLAKKLREASEIEDPEKRKRDTRYLTERWTALTKIFFNEFTQSEVRK